ncbi:MAG TPA: bifunctional nuclease family protein [bacterium]|nr:bifunctional nuclease family protein [bacterium]HNO91579.1 bifunctional nuclease family protein [bacterium]
MELQVEIKWIIEDEQSNGYILQLVETGLEKGRMLPVVIGAPEAHSIALELQGIKPFRPFTHDLAVQILDALDAEVDKVVITELNKNTFFASIHIRSNSVGEQVIDSRPSDAIAIAIRVGSPIFVEEKVMEAAGLDVDVQSGAYVKQTKKVPASEASELSMTPLEKLEKDLQKAVESENYELAAKLRDQINLLKS